MPTRLQSIVDAHRAMAAGDRRDLEELIIEANATATPRDFYAALVDSPDVALITEIKRRSPSAGDLNVALDPAVVAADYASGGAACLSVLTDVEFFGGSTADLRSARAAVGLPVLRKDFTVDARDIADARIMGADAVLLIVAALSDHELERFSEFARLMQLTPLFEVHDKEEVKRALQVGADVIGVNQRDLHTFEIDHARAIAMREHLPASVVTVAESGIRSPEDVSALAEAGFDAALIGTSLVRSKSTVEAVRAMARAGTRS